MTRWIPRSSGQEADAWRLAQAAERTPIDVAPVDLQARGVIPLADLDAVAQVGTHAAYMGALSQVSSGDRHCPGEIGAPSSGFALTLVHAREHLIESGAGALLPAVDAPREERLAALAAVRDAIRAHPVDPFVLGAVMDELTTTFPGTPVRLWPSSNAAGTPGFSGAGLYPPRTLPADPDPAAVESALQDIWASQWSAHASDERAFHGIEPSSVAMGVFVTAAPTGPVAASGNLITRNLYFPLRRDHVISLHRGLAALSRPAPGVDPEQIVYDTRTGQAADRVGRRSWSTLAPGAPLLDDARLNRLVCRGTVAAGSLRPRLDPGGRNHWYATDIAWWVPAVGEPRIERIRPMTFGPRVPPADCREL